MQSPVLRHLTASEPLSLHDEYAMQQSWQNDQDKLTFIVLARPPHAAPDDALTDDDIRALPMIGDVNLFLKGSPQDDDFEAEVEVMIAEPAYRRQRLAHTALSLLLAYATSPASPAPLPVPPARLVARIGQDNAPSIRLFESLGFEVVRRVDVFNELEMRTAANGAHAHEWTAGAVVPFEAPDA